MRRWKAHRGKVAGLAFSRDGRTLASVSGSSSEVYVWDALAGPPARRLQPPPDTDREDRLHPRTNACAVAFAPSADLLAVGRKHWVEVWDTATWACAASLCTAYAPGWAYAVACGPGPAPVVVTSHYGQAVVRARAGGTLVPVASAPTDNNPSFAVSADGTRLATQTMRRVQVWDAATGRFRHELEHPRGNYTGPVRFSPDGSRLAFAYSKTIESHPATLDDDDDVVRYAGHTNKVWTLRYTPDGRSLISASSDGTARVWDAATGAERRCFAMSDGKVAVADVSPDGTVAAVGTETGHIVVWDLDD